MYDEVFRGLLKSEMKWMLLWVVVSLSVFSQAATQHENQQLGNGHEAFTKTCEEINRDTAPIVMHFLCDAHALSFQETKHGDYRIQGSLDYREGPPNPPLQMGLDQYLMIGLTAMELPTPNPTVLFFGCGQDTRMFHNLLERLNGSIVFLESDPSWAAECRKTGAEVRLIHATGTVKSHNRIIRDGTWSTEDETLLVENDLENRSWGIIVIDGPPAYGPDLPGRSMALFTAIKLARQSPQTHHTHIFLHDAAREHERIISEAFINEKVNEFITYVGNVLPRKGLKHWIISGESRTDEEVGVPRCSAF